MIEAPPDTNFLNLSHIGGLRNNEAILAAVRHINQKYLYWTEAKRRPLPTDIKPEVVWSLAKLNRSLRLNYLQFKDLPSVKFSYTVTDDTNAILHRLDMEMGGKLGSNQLLIDAEGEKQRYLMASSLMEEAIASSQLEGAATTRVKAKDMLRKKRPPRDRSEQMIVNNYQTIQFILQHKQEPLTPDLLCTIQGRMTQETMDNEEDAGRFRMNDDVHVANYITGEVVHIPPPVIDLPKWLQALCDLANEELDIPGFVHPIVRASMLHFLMGYIHPFADGNGRTARAVFYWYLLRKGYWLTEYLSISRIIHRASSQYAKAFLHTELDENDLTYFINYQVQTLERAFESLQEHLQQKLDERKKLYSVRQLSGLNERQMLLVQELIDEPLMELTIREVETHLGVAYATARADLAGLEEAGLLTQGKVGRQKIVYFRAANFESVLNQLRTGRKQ